MSTFNFELKNGNQLIIPAEYYPRYADIEATRVNLSGLTPINWFKYFFRMIGSCIFNSTFAVLSIVNVSLCAPILVSGNYIHQKEAYYFYLFVGFIFSYYISKFHRKFIQKDPLSVDGLAQRLGYRSSTSLLKPYDEHMLKEIIHINKIKISRTNLFFYDLYCIFFDDATAIRLYDIYCKTPHLRVVK